MPPINNILFEVFGLIFGIVILIKLWRDPNKFYFIAFLFAILMTTIVELTGIREQGSYYYDDFVFVIPATPNLANLVGGTGRDFPIFIAVQWAIIAYCLSRMVQKLNIRWYLAPLVCGFVAVSIDMALDPIAASSRLVSNIGDFCYGSTSVGAAEGVGYWVWCIAQNEPGQFWFGVPIQNFYAWFLVVAVFLYFQSIAYNSTYNSSWKFQFNALFTSMASSIATFFLALDYFLNLGYQYGWIVWGTLMLSGVAVLVKAGMNRVNYEFDWWAYSVVIAAAIFSIMELVLQLRNTASTGMIILTLLWVLFSLLVSAWIILGKRMLGQPYP